MVKRAARITHPTISISVYSEHTAYHITNDSDPSVTNNKPVTVGKSTLENSIVSCRTQNTLEDDTATFTVVLSGLIRWDNVINSNDIFIIRMNPNEANAKTKVKNDNVMTGLVSDVSVIKDFGNDSIMYQITGQSMAKVFTQYKIGLPSQVESQLSDMGWLWDTNAELTEEVEEGGSGGGSDLTLASGSNPKKVWVALRGAGYSEAAAAGAMGNIQEESGFVPNKWNGGHTGGSSKPQGSDGGYGLIQWSGPRETGLMHYLKKHDAVDNSSELKYQLMYLLNVDPGKSVPSSYRKKTSVSDAALWWFRNVERIDDGTGPDRVSYATAYYHKFRGTKVTGSSLPSGSSSDDSDSSGNISGTVNASQSAIDREKANSIGVAFFGNNVAQVQTNLINRFRPYIKYTYENGAKGIWDFIDVTNFHSWEDYEYLFDSSSFTNFNGSLYDLQQAALRAPFNEMFYESLPNGKSKLVVRRTPFNPDDWQKLDINTVDQTAVIEHEVSKNDLQEYSVFIVNPASSTMMGISDGLLLSAYPQTNRDLIDKYGYSKYEVEDLYLSGKGDNNEQKKAKGASSSKTAETSKDNSLGTEFKLADVNSFLGRINHTALRLRKDKYAKKLADAANNISATQAYTLINDYIANAYNLTAEDMDTDLDMANGGGLPNTGTTEVSYTSLNSCLSKSNGDEATFLAKAKSTLKNVSDEFLRSVWQSYASGNNKLDKKEYKKLIKNDRNKGDSTGDTTATDLKYFTKILYNWYADNFNYYSGNVVVSGNPDIRLGNILDVIDGADLAANGYPGRRYYIESVINTFTFTDGYTTQVGVTRGMRRPVNGSADPRFHTLWGTSIDFLGGYMGEATIANLALAEKVSRDGDNGSSGDVLSGKKGNAVAVKAATIAYGFRESHYKKKKEVYALGGHGERGSINPLTHDINGGTLVLDCSSFIYWCFKMAGATIPTTTTSIANDTSQFKRVHIPSNSTKGMRIGDLVEFYGQDHIMFYIGGGKFCGWNGGATNASWDPSGGCQVRTLSEMGGSHDSIVLRYK